MSETPSPSPAFQAVIDYFEEKDFNYSSYPEEQRVTLRMSGKNANFRFCARITHDGDYLQVTAYYPFFVREEKLRLSVAELLTRANYNMPLGKFEMDMKDGEVLFHLTHLIEGNTLPSEVVERHFMTAFFTIDRYFPALMQHIHAGYTPEDAVFHAELDTHAERVEDTPNPSVKPKASPSTTAEGKPPAKRASRKKPSGDRDSPQGDLPL
jgi:hypothetical protein